MINRAEQTGRVVVLGYPMRTVSVGHFANPDPLRDHPVQWIKHANGSAQSIVAVTLSTMGHDVAMLGSRGIDREGDECVAVLRRHGVNVDGLVPHDKTAQVIIHVDPSAQRQWYGYTYEDALGLSSTQLDRSTIVRSDAVCYYAGFGIPLDDQHANAGARAARQARVPLVAALANADLIRLYGAGRFTAALSELEPTVVIGSEAEWGVLGINKEANWVLPEWARFGVVTRGPNSAVFMRQGRYDDMPLTQVLDPTVDGASLPWDQTGAGDTVCASITSSLVANQWRRGTPVITLKDVQAATDLATQSVTVAGPGLGLSLI